MNTLSNIVYVDDTWVKIKDQEGEVFTDPINSVEKNIEFSREDTRDSRLTFLEMEAHTNSQSSMSPTTHKLRLIMSLQHQLCISLSDQLCTHCC